MKERERQSGVVEQARATAALWNDFAERNGSFADDQIPNSRLNPTFKIKGVSVVLHPLEIVSVANGRLGERVGSLAAEGDAIVAALDELLRVPSGRLRIAVGQDAPLKA